MKKPLRAAIYCRVGNADPEGLALDMQQQSACKYANDKGYNIETAATMSCSRFGRNMVDLLNYTKALQRENAAVDFTKEGISSPRLVDILGAATEE